MKIMSIIDTVIFWRMQIPHPPPDNIISQNNRVQQITTLPQLLSSHAHNLMHHFQASPPSPFPKSFISATTSISLSEGLKRRLDLSFKPIPSNQGSHQNKKESPSPNSQIELSAI